MFEDSEDDSLWACADESEDPGHYHHDPGSLLLMDSVDRGERSGYADIAANCAKF